MSQLNVSNNQIQQPIQNLPPQTGQVNPQNAQVPQGLENARLGDNHPPRVRPQVAQPPVSLNARLGNAAPAPRTQRQPQISGEKLSEMIWENSKDLPADMKAMCKETVDTLRAIYGEKYVPKDATIKQLADKDSSVKASLQGIPPKQRMAQLPYLILKGCQEHIIQNIVADRVKAQADGLTKGELRTVAEQFLRKPGIADRLYKAQDMQGVNAVMDELKNTLEESIHTYKEITRCRDSSMQWAADMLAKETGYPPELLGSILVSGHVKSNQTGLATKILDGKLEPGKTIEQAYREKVQEFVHKRLAEMAEVDGLGISPESKEKIKDLILRYGGKDIDFKAAEATGGTSGFGTYLLGVLSGNPSKDKVKAEVEKVQTIIFSQLGAIYGDKWGTLGAEGHGNLMPIVLQCMLDATPGLAEALRKHVDALADFPLLIELSSPLSNKTLAAYLEEGKFGSIPANVAQGLWTGLNGLIADFGAENVPASSIERLFGAMLPGGKKSVKEAVLERIRSQAEPVTKESLAAILREATLPLVRDNALNSELKSLAEGQGVTQFDKRKDVEPILAQLSAVSPDIAGALRGADSVAAIRELLANVPGAAEIVAAVPFLRATWQQNASKISQGFAQPMGLTESRVQDALYHSQEILGLLRGKYFAMPQNERPALGSEAFAAFCQTVIQGVMNDKAEAIRGIKEMTNEQLGDAERNRLTDQVLTSSVKPILFTAGLEIASVAADGLEADRLEAALNAKRLNANEVLAALDELESQIAQAVPDELNGQPLTDADKTFLRAQVRQAFLHRYGQAIADKLAHLPAAQALALASGQGANPERCALLHNARGMVADAWLAPSVADRINNGTATLGDERKLEDVLRMGEPLFAQYAPKLPQHLHGILRHYIGSMNLSDKDVSLTVARMAGCMLQWKSFTAQECPQHISAFLKQSHQGTADSYLNVDGKFENNVFNTMSVDIPRSLYTINGQSFYVQGGSPDDAIAAFKNALLRGRNPQALSQEELAHFNKAQRFVSSLMQQGSWVPFFSISQHMAKTTGANGQNMDVNPGSLVNRPDDYVIYGGPLLGTEGSTIHAELQVSEDGTTATVRLNKTFHFRTCKGESYNAATFGSARITQEVTIDLRNDPVITNCTLSQQLLDSQRIGER